MDVAQHIVLVKMLVTPVKAVSALASVGQCPGVKKITFPPAGITQTRQCREER